MVVKSLGLFQKGFFKLHSGAITDFKIDCDALTDTDIDAIAYEMLCALPQFSKVEGVPRGGLRLAKALKRYEMRSGPLLIVDDVFTTGTSMVAHRGDREAIGAVIFSRVPADKLPPWIKAMFVTEWL